MEPTIDEFRLEDIAGQHGIAAGVFVPFAVLRLADDPAATESVLTVKRRGFGGEEEERRLRLRWSPESLSVYPLGLQDQTITELAALGVACAVIALYAGLRVQGVARQGERFDFWVTDGARDYGLEVSGTMTPDVEGRHREKVRQLLANPYGIGGYVVVVGFATRTVLLSLHEAREGSE